jgi:hypothetical protein
MPNLLYLGGKLLRMTNLRLRGEIFAKEVARIANGETY